jgi:hypothetical protein
MSRSAYMRRSTPLRWPTGGFTAGRRRSANSAASFVAHRHTFVQFTRAMTPLWPLLFRAPRARLEIIAEPRTNDARCSPADFKTCHPLLLTDERLKRSATQSAEGERWFKLGRMRPFWRLAGTATGTQIFRPAGESRPPDDRGAYAAKWSGSRIVRTRWRTNRRGCNGERGSMSPKDAGLTPPRTSNTSVVGLVCSYPQYWQRPKWLRVTASLTWRRVRAKRRRSHCLGLDPRD